MASEWNLWVWLLNILEFHRMCTILCCDASPIGIYWQHILFFDKLVCRIIKERLRLMLAIWQPSPKSFLSVSSMLCTNLAA